MRTSITLNALVAALALGAWGCEDGVTTPDPIDDEALRADAALVAADGMFQDLVLMDQPSVWAQGVSGPELVGIQVQGSRTFTRTVTFFDAAGLEQDSYDPLTTAKLHILADLTRTVEHTFWSADIQRSREMEVTGLLGEETERTWNGVTSGVVAKSRHPEGEVIRTYDMTSSGTFNDVVRGVPRAEHPYPLSGTIVRTVHIVVTEGDQIVGERNVTVTITFDGSQFATLEAGGETWTVDLANQGVKNRFGRQNG